MIDINKLTKEDKGRDVILRDDHKGKIVSWDKELIYVRYYNPDKEWIGTKEENKKNGLLSYPDDMDFIAPLKSIEIVTRADLMDLDND